MHRMPYPLQRWMRWGVGHFGGLGYSTWVASAIPITTVVHNRHTWIQPNTRTLILSLLFFEEEHVHRTDTPHSFALQVRVGM
jgi:hypothetical protein